MTLTGFLLALVTGLFVAVSREVIKKEIETVAKMIRNNLYKITVLVGLTVIIILIINRTS